MNKFLKILLSIIGVLVFIFFIFENLLFNIMVLKYLWLPILLVFITGLIIILFDREKKENINSRNNNKNNNLGNAMYKPEVRNTVAINKAIQYDYQNKNDTEKNKINPPQENLEKPVYDIFDRKNNKWICGKCGNENYIIYDICQKCGKLFAEKAETERHNIYHRIEEEKDEKTLVKDICKNTYIEQKIKVFDINNDFETIVRYLRMELNFPSEIEKQNIDNNIHPFIRENIEKNIITIKQKEIIKGLIKHNIGFYKTIFNKYERG